MKKDLRVAVAAFRQELEPHGFTVEVDNDNCGHPHLIATRGDESFRVAVSNTPRIAESQNIFMRQRARRILAGSWSAM